MVWSNNDNWMITGDHGGYVKYWQSNMNNVKMYQAHKEPIRGIRYTISKSILNILFVYIRIILFIYFDEKIDKEKRKKYFDNIIIINSSFTHAHVVPNTTDPP